MTDNDLTKKYENRGVPPKWFYCFCAWLMGALVVGFFYAYAAALWWC